ncbi:MAG: DUF5908 family protein [Ferruginibacter sp.]
MPLEIRELQINVTVNQQGASGAAGTASNSASGGAANADEKKALVNQCVEQVIDIINNKKER